MTPFHFFVFQTFHTTLNLLHYHSEKIPDIYLVHPLPVQKNDSFCELVKFGSGIFTVHDRAFLIQVHGSEKVAEFMEEQ